MRSPPLISSLYCVAICTAVLLCPPCWAEPLRTAPPPGFDDIDRPQRTLIDLVVLDRIVRGVAVALHGPMLQFEEPLRLLSELKEITDSQSILDTLSGPLPTNAHLVCRENISDRKDCGRLIPRVAGVIYDVERFRAELFVNAAFIRSEIGSDMFLPPPQREAFAFSKLLGSASGSINGETRASLHQELQIGAGATRLMTTTFISSEDAVELDARKR